MIGGRVEAGPLGTGSWFVYRSPYEGPSGKRVWRLPDRSVLGWFQRLWAATADVVEIEDEAHAHDWVDAQLGPDLGGPVYGLTSVFVDGHQHGLPAPATWQELRALVQAHLYVEDEARVGEHSVRASTDDDEVPFLYYYLFDDTVAIAHPDRVAYLLHEPWELPDRADGDGGFEPGVPVTALTPSPSGGHGATYVATIPPTDDDSGWCPDWKPFVLHGVRLPDLATWLRSVTPGSFEAAVAGSPSHEPRRFTDWPQVLLLLRALLDPHGRRLTPALRRYCRLPSPNPTLADSDWLFDAHDAAHAQALHIFAHSLLRRPDLRVDPRRGPQRDPQRDPRACRVRETAHLAQMALHDPWGPGHNQVFLFDDVWAAANPHLARSLLRCAAPSTWDPFDDGRDAPSSLF
jgi:hypothetical protein